MGWSVCNCGAGNEGHMSRLILLTGATGFVGRQVLRSLDEKNIRLRIIIRDGAEVPSDYSAEIENVIRTADLFSEPVSWWEEACKGVDTIIHVAWYTEPGKYLQSRKNLDCLIGTLKLAQGAIKSSVRRFGGVGTCFEYDLSQGTLSIETPIKPHSPYAAAKAAAYVELSQCLPSENIEFCWCRLFYLYGEGEDERRLVPYIRARLSTGEPAELSSGTQVRDYLDVAQAGWLIAAVALSTKQGAINICSGVPITVRELAEKIADEYGRRDLLWFGEREDNPVDPPYVVGITNSL